MRLPKGQEQADCVLAMFLVAIANAKLVRHAYGQTMPEGQLESLDNRIEHCWNLYKDQVILRETARTNAEHDLIIAAVSRELLHPSWKSLLASARKAYPQEWG